MVVRQHEKLLYIYKGILPSVSLTSLKVCLYLLSQTLYFTLKFLIKPGIYAAFTGTGSSGV